MSMEVDLDLQGAVEVILHKDLLVWFQRESYVSRVYCSYFPKANQVEMPTFGLGCPLL